MGIQKKRLIFGFLGFIICGIISLFISTKMWISMIPNNNIELSLIFLIVGGVIGFLLGYFLTKRN